MPIITSTFKPAWWLKNPHLQTMWGTSFKKETKLDLISQKIALEDEDFIDVVKTPDINDKPIVVILHGLEGCIGSHYVKPLIKTLADNGYGVFFMHFRGCGYEPNKNTKGYSANDSEDLQTVVNKIKHEYKRDPFAVIGFSLGGSVVLKWLGEKGENANTTLGIGVSVPFKLKDAAMKLENGFSRIYQKRLLGICKNKFEKNISKEISSLNVSIESINNFYQFDNQITSQIHGFKNADDYYQQCSSRQFLKKIQKNTLILHSKDDPFMWEHSAPKEDELSDNVYLELTEQGGHVGFISGKMIPWKITYWLDHRIVAWLNEQRTLMKEKQ